MAITNKRKSVKKSNTDSKLKSKLKEQFDWLTEADEDGLPTDEDSLPADDSSDLEGVSGGLDNGDDLGGGADDSGMTASDDPQSELDQSQLQQFDSEVDDILQTSVDASLENNGDDEDLLSEEDDLMEDDELFDSPEDDYSTDPNAGIDDGVAVDGDLNATDEDDFDIDHDSDLPAVPVTDLLDTDDLQNIIDSPDSFHALEDDLVNKITSEDDGEDVSDVDDFSDDTMDEADNPWEGIEDLPGFEKGYEGKDIKDGLQESEKIKKRKAEIRKRMKENVALAAELKALNFAEESNVLNDKITSTVSNKGIVGGANSNVDKVTDGKKGIPVPNIAAAQPMSESVKKSKMLVKAAAVILKLKEMNKAEKAKANKLVFENAKLAKVNAILTVAGNEMTAEVKKKIVESFVKCKTQEEANKVYNSIVKVIKEHRKPKINNVVKKTQNNKAVKTVTSLKENSNPDVKLTVAKDQQRKAYLMGLSSAEDMYYNF